MKVIKRGENSLRLFTEDIFENENSSIISKINGTTMNGIDTVPEKIGREIDKSFENHFEALPERIAEELKDVLK